jgi:hypothetical protein
MDNYAFLGHGASLGLHPELQLKAASGPRFIAAAMGPLWVDLGHPARRLDDRDASAANLRASALSTPHVASAAIARGVRSFTLGRKRLQTVADQTSRSAAVRLKTISAGRFRICRRLGLARCQRRATGLRGGRLYGLI